MSWSPKSVFSFPDWIPPFRDSQVATLSAALISRRNSPSIQNTWRVRQAIADLFLIPVHSHDAFDIMTIFFARGYTGSYQIGMTLEEIRQERNDLNVHGHNLTDEDL